jgi:hypothetical protein
MPTLLPPMPQLSPDPLRTSRPVTDDELPDQFPDNPANEKRVVGYIEERYQASREFDRAFKERCLTDWMNVNSKLPDNWPYYWGLFMPETSMACHDTIENIMATVFPKENFFDIRAVSGQTELATELMREAMKFSLRRAKYKERYFFWEQDAIFYGNSVVHTCASPAWKPKRIMQPQGDPFGYGLDMGATTRTEHELNVWPEIQNISRWNLFPFPGPVEGGSIQHAPFFIVRRFIPLAACRANASKPWAMWRNTEKLVGSYNVNRTSRTINTGDETAFEDLWQLLQYAGLNIGETQTEGPNCVKYCEVLYYYEAPPGEPGCRAFAVMAEGQLLACDANPYEHGLKPLADIKWHPTHTDLWQCYGVPREIKAYQDKINIMEAQRADRREIDLKPMLLVGESAQINPMTQLAPWPGAIVKSQDIAAVKMLEFPNVAGELYREEESASVGIQRATRISNVSKGVDDGSLGQGAKTARGMAFLTDSSQRAAAFKLLFHEEIGVAPNLMQIAQILQQVIRPGTIINIGDVNETLKRAGVNANAIPLNPQDIAGEWEFYAVGSSRTQDPATVAHNMTTFWMPILTNPERARLYDIDEIEKQGHELIFGHSIQKYRKNDKDLQEALAKPPPAPKEMIPKFKDLKDRPLAAAALLERVGLPSDDTPPITEREKEQAKTQREVAKPVVNALASHVTKEQPRLLPKREAQ